MISDICVYIQLHICVLIRTYTKRIQGGSYKLYKEFLPNLEIDQGMSPVLGTSLFAEIFLVMNSFGLFEAGRSCLLICSKYFSL